MTINWTNVTTIQGFLDIPNQNTANTFWPMMLYMVVCVVFMAMLSFGIESAVLVSLFLGIVLGIILVYIDIMGMMWLGILIALEIFFFIYFMWSSNKNQ